MGEPESHWLSPPLSATGPRGFAPRPVNSSTPATTTTITREIGRNTFQPKRIN